MSGELPGHPRQGLGGAHFQADDKHPLALVGKLNRHLTSDHAFSVPAVAGPGRHLPRAKAQDAPQLERKHGRRRVALGRLKLCRQLLGKVGGWPHLGFAVCLPLIVGKVD